MPLYFDSLLDLPRFLPWGLQTAVRTCGSVSLNCAVVVIVVGLNQAQNVHGTYMAQELFLPFVQQEK